MAQIRQEDTGPDFENRGLAIARAIYDPSNTQGPIMFRGREHDAVFVGDRTIVAFEFTVMRTRDKAEKDATKIRDVLLSVGAAPGNKHKALQGFFVTAGEPTADQRMAVDAVARSAGVSISSLSYLSLRKSLIDTDEYIALRRQAPFGSTVYQLPSSSEPDPQGIYVEPTFIWDKSGQATQLNSLVSSVKSGDRTVLLADFGAGKSEALRQMFERLRRIFFKSPSENRFPLHINLRDCYGLRSPREVLRRHAEDIGFAAENSLIAAWRAGACDLLLDGFDELVPARWVGGARDLRQVRWQALDPVRRLINETPLTSGIVITGRPQYFSSDAELLETLALSGGSIVRLNDFDDAQVNSLVGSSISLAEWVPPRPLLVKFLIQNGLLDEASGRQLDPSTAWRSMLDIIAGREADRVSSVPRASVKALLARIATLSRSGDAGLRPVTVDEMRKAFRDVCGYDPDEEGLQLLLRLPGLASSQESTTSLEDNSLESRRFVDPDLSDAAFGEDLATYIANPYGNHPLSQAAGWTEASRSLASGTAAASLVDSQFEPSVVTTAIKRRIDQGMYDAILLDCVATSEALGVTPGKTGQSPLILEVIIPRLEISSESGFMNDTTFSGCVIEVLDVTDAEARIPTFQSCLIGRIEGWSRIPSEFETHFADSEIVEFSAEAQTTVGLMNLGVDNTDAVALVILKKVYQQAGSGRKESSLPRGIPLELRDLVPQAIDALVSTGYLSAVTRRRDTIFLPVKGKGTEVARFLSSPHQFSLTRL